MLPGIQARPPKAGLLGESPSGAEENPRLLIHKHLAAPASVAWLPSSPAEAYFDTTLHKKESVTP